MNGFIVTILNSNGLTDNWHLTWQHFLIFLNRYFIFRTSVWVLLFTTKNCLFWTTQSIHGHVLLLKCYKSRCNLAIFNWIIYGRMSRRIPWHFNTIFKSTGWWWGDELVYGHFQQDSMTSHSSGATYSRFCGLILWQYELLVAIHLTTGRLGHVISLLATFCCGYI